MGVSSGVVMLSAASAAGVSLTAATSTVTDFSTVFAADAPLGLIGKR